jgi:DNA-binding beta-propeller fold protein YncE
VTKPGVTTPEVTKPEVAKPEVTKPEVAKPEVAVQKVVRDGISVEFIPSVAAPGQGRPDPMEGEDVDLRFWIRGAAGERLAGIKPAAWIDARTDATNAASGSDVCKQKVQSFVSGTLNARPQVDLNSYFILALNAEPVISVLDPILGFGGSRLYTDIRLASPGFDWVLSKDQRRLFVAMPLINQVAAIDTDSWKVIKNIDAGVRPTHLAFAPDDKTLWVAGQNADAAAPSVTVIDAAALAVVSTLRTGRGPHGLAFPNDDVAAVTNGADGTVTLIDLMTLRAIKEVPIGGSPTAIGASPLSGALYVGDARSGTISVIDPAKQQVSAHMDGKPGLTMIRFAPGGRFGFVTVPSANVVEVIDSSNATIVSTIDIPKKPDQVTFTETFAYVRSADADTVTMIRLADLGPGRKPNLVDFPSGQLPASAAKVEGNADAIIAAPQSGAVIVVNPADKLLYHYEEGMAAPMGNYQVYGQTPKAALVVDRSLRESAPGVFSIKTQVPAAGMYDVAFFLDSPRVVHCFNLSVRGNPALKKLIAERKVVVQPLFKPSTIHVNEPVELKFKLTNPVTGKTHDAVKDFRVLTFLAPGVWQERQFARPLGDGVYSVTATVPQPGIYYVFVECPSLGLRLNALRAVMLSAVAADARKESP